MVPELYAKISDALEKAKAEPKSREMSLVITKLEEALMWFNATMGSKATTG